MNNILDIYNIFEYYGDINIEILNEVLTMFPNTKGFKYNDKQYGITQDDLKQIIQVFN